MHKKDSSKSLKKTSRKIKELFVNIKYRHLLTQDQSLKIMDSRATIDYIIRHQCSISRFGDGELKMVFRYFNKKVRVSKGFQRYDEHLAKRLAQVLKGGGNKKLLICIPYLFRPEGMTERTEDARFFWKRFICRYHQQMLQLLSQSCLYGDTNISRFYLSKAEKSECKAYVLHLKKIWEQRDICFVEGKYSRFGVGNDLFDNASSIKRIICPSVNAFDKYSQILNTICNRVPKETLIILALGQTASVLAHDLSDIGYQALDLGHIDVEYEWMLMKATQKIALPNKAVNEAAQNQVNDRQDLNREYVSQIIAQIS